jgi:hypothetical protein
MLATLTLLGLVAFAVFRILNAARHDDDDDGPGGPRRVRVRIRNDNPRMRGRQ